MTIKFNVKSEFKSGDIEKRFESAIKQAQFTVDQQVLKDSNAFIPMSNQKNMMASGVNHSKPGDGEVIWNTPYARRLYYNPQYNFSKDYNPQAQGLWFEQAKSRSKDTWLNMGKKMFKSIFD